MLASKIIESYSNIELENRIDEFIEDKEVTHISITSTPLYKNSGQKYTVLILYKMI